MFSWASWAKRYSFPIRRAGSPVHFSSGPSVAKSTLAAFRTRTRAWFVLRARGSVEPAQPDPQQVLDLPPAEVRHHGHVEALRPLHPPVLPDAPRVALDLHALEGRRGLLREVGLHHHEALPEADEGRRARSR